MNTHIKTQNTERIEEDIEANKDIAAFSYLWIFSVVVLFLRKDSKFVQFHAKQATVLFVLSVLLWMVPIFGKYLAIFAVAGMIIGFINATQGEFYRMPIVADIVEKEITPATIVVSLKKFLSYLGKILKGIFVKKVALENEKNGRKNESSYQDMVSKIQELESHIKEENYLKGNSLTSISPAVKETVDKIKNYLLSLDKNIESEYKPYVISFKKGHIFMSLGKFSDESFIMSLRSRSDLKLSDGEISFSYPEWGGESEVSSRFKWIGVDIDKQKLLDFEKIKVLIQEVYKDNF